MERPLRVVHLEDDVLDAELIHETLLLEGLSCDITNVERRSDFVAAIEQAGVELILADFALPDFDGLSALAIAREKRPEIPFIFISGAIGEDRAIETLKSGATDYVLKHRLSGLGPAVKRALREVGERQARERATAELRQAKEQAEQTAERVTSLQTITAALSESLTPEQVARAVIDQSIQVLGATAGSVVYLDDPAADGAEAMLTILYSRGYRRSAVYSWERFPLSTPAPLALAVREARPVFFDSRETTLPDYPNLAPFINLSGHNAWAAVPLALRTVTIGAIGFSFDNPRAFDAEERDFMLAVARQCAQALERARLFDAERRARAEAEAARARLEFLAEASALLAASLNYETTLAQVAELVVPRIADWCAVDMVKEDGSTERVAVAHVDPARVSLAFELEARYPRHPQSDRGLPYALRTGRSLLESDIADSRIAESSGDDAYLEMVRRLGYRSAMIVPLNARGHVLGALTFAIAESEHRFGPQDLAFAEELARRAAVAVDNARLYSQANRLNLELEQRVARRTAALEVANTRLQLANAELETEIAERTLADQMLKDSERRLSEAQKIAHLGNWAWQVETNAVTWSDELHRIYGRQPGEFDASYEGFLELVYPEDREIARQTVEGSLASGQPFIYYHRLVRPDGTLRTLQARGEAVVDGAGRVTGMVGTALDVTELKEAEAQLQRQARQLAALAQMGQTVTSTLDLPAVLSYVLQQLAALLPAGAISIVLDDEAVPSPGRPRQLTLAATSDPDMSQPDHNHLQAILTVADLVTRQRAPVWIQNASEDANLASALVEEARPPICSLLAVPLTLRRQVIGVVQAVHGQAGAFSADDLSLLEAAANWTAIAIGNARLYQAEKHARQVADTLQAASLAFGQTLDLQRIFDRLLDYMGQLVPFDSANIMLMRGDSRLVMFASSGYDRWIDPAIMPEIAFDLETSPSLRQVVASQTGKIVNDTESFPGWERLPGTQHVRSWLGIPLLSAGSVIGVFSLDKAEPDYFDQSHLDLATTLTAQASVAIQNAQLFGAVRAGREQLRRLSQQAMAVLEEERQRVSRELHDEAGQALTAVKIGLALVERELPAGSDGLRQQLAGIIELTGETMEQIRLLAQGLRPPALDTVGIASVIDGYCRDFAARTRLPVDVVAPPVPTIPEEIVITLYRFLQEALTNVVRHAEARRAEVELSYDGREVGLKVADDGHGFEPQQILSLGGAIHGIGLLGMRERLELLGGSLAIESGPGAGTVLTARIPLRSQETP